jgi:hypothetical protein
VMECYGYSSVREHTCSTAKACPDRGLQGCPQAERLGLGCVHLSALAASLDGRLREGPMTALPD